MSAYTEQPFSDFEERYLLAEILKRSSLPPSTLVALINDARIEPAWTDIALPHGRSVSACQQAYNALFARTLGPPPPQSSTLPPIEPVRGVKRPYSSMGDATSSLPREMPRELQPRPPALPPPGVNGQPMLLPPSPFPHVAPPRKKRGRPTKAEWERRQQEAQERGEVWPKPRKAKTRTSAETPEESKKADDTSSPLGAEAGKSTAAQLPSMSVPKPGSALSPPLSRPTSSGPVQLRSETLPRAEGSSVTSPRTAATAQDRPMEGIQYSTSPSQGSPPSVQQPLGDSRAAHEQSGAHPRSPSHATEYPGKPIHDASQERHGWQRA